MVDKPVTTDPQTTPDFKVEAEKIGDATIEFLKDEEELPIHADDRWAVIMDIQQALIDAYNKGYANAKA
jgi:hypothetical protein